MRYSEHRTDRTVRDASRDAAIASCFVGMLDRMPSERSEDKLVFLINVQPSELFAECVLARRKFNATIGGPLPSGWALMMRAIKCLKGIRWMPWR